MKLEHGQHYKSTKPKKKNVLGLAFGCNMKVLQQRGIATLYDNDGDGQASTKASNNQRLQLLAHNDTTDKQQTRLEQ